MKTAIKWGILGTSFISEVMANAIKESETSQLVAIGSRSLTTAKNFSEKFSIPKIYTDYQTLLDDNEIDAVYIGLRTGFTVKLHT